MPNEIDIFLRTQLTLAQKAGTALENLEDPVLAATQPSRNNMIGVTSSKRLVFGSDPLRAGIVEQQGCTTVYVITKRGMWYTHFWEDPAISEIVFDNRGEAVSFNPPDIDIFENDAVGFIDLKNKPVRLGTSDSVLNS